ncbi:MULTISPECIES: DUF4157 domain-containing protein [unclassified Natrinema]|uniref:eCIS core domain-containing protein n=1 Tax=unclassified Natrinema TaxID=2622230 RepID=UPI00026D50FD|nr:MULTISPECIES: DUF4157 domain-containing protein [unclassified Natrinema]AFO58107.1 transposase [Natrinema sp. J7-2]
MGFRSERTQRNPTTESESKTATVPDVSTARADDVTVVSRATETRGREPNTGVANESIPDDIDLQNGRSLRRSTVAAHDSSPAGNTQVPDSVRDVISSRGRSLETSIQRAVEDRMGDSLGDVRIHTGPKAAQACDQINARAFTVGNHVAFNAGEYDPESPEGQHVLAHELAHVRQQTGGAVSMLPQEDLGLEIDPDPQLEREAEETAQRVMEGGELGIQRMAGTEVHVQRLSEDKVFDALALFEAELEEDGELSETREAHNKNQLSHLHDIAQDAIEKKDKQNSLALKQEVQQAAEPNRVAEELAQRGGSIADLKTEIQDLKNSIDADLEDVALTEDQRLMLEGSTDIDKWDKVGWTTIKALLSATGISKLIKMANMSKELAASSVTAAADAGSQSAGFDINERGTQLVAQARRREITSLDDLKNIWRQSNGTLEQRAEQIEQEIRNGTWLEEDGSRGLSKSMKNSK